MCSRLGKLSRDPMLPRDVLNIPAEARPRQSAIV